MHLYLLRHADADTVAEHDADRCLSEKGLQQAKKVARFCEAHEVQLSLVLSSPIRRAHETALIVSAHLRAELLVVPWLSTGMDPEAALGELSAYRAQGSIMLIGHEPDFSRLAARLLGLPREENIRIRKASLSLFELGAPRAGTATLLYSLPCKLM